MSTPTELRMKLRDAGFNPIPTRGKNPGMVEGWAWQKLISAPDEHIAMWGKSFPDAINTGILTRTTPALDIDILHQEGAEAVEALVQERFEERGYILTRIGNPPKRAILFRTGELFPKYKVELTAPDGSSGQKIELLADGQQVVVAGIHPDTRRPYSWNGGEPWAIAHDDLPYITREEAHKLVDDAADLLVREFGFKIAGISNGKTDRTGTQGERQAGNEPHADAELLERALNVIPNNLGWDEWNNVGMAIWRATNGSGSGFAIFDAWSRKSEKHDAKNTAAKWAAYFRSPPSSIGAGTIFHLANEAKPGWRTDGPKVIWERDAPPIGPDQDRRATYESSGDVDAQPVDLWAELAMPSLPEGALPDVIQNLAQHQATLMGVDPGGMAAAALTVCAAAIPDRIQVQVKEHDDGWVESARLWVGLVGLPSTKKTPLTSVAVRPLENIDAELYRKYAEAKEAYDALPVKEKKGAKRPVQHRVMLMDVTIEHVQEVMRDSPDGILVFHDELAGWFGSMDKYNASAGASANRAFWLQAFNGKPYTWGRITRGSGHISNLSTCVLGGIQPSVIQKVAQDGVDDGLIQRLCPIVLRPGGVGDDVPPHWSVNAYSNLISTLHDLQPPMSSSTILPMEVPLRFSTKAQELRRELERKHFDLTRLETVNPMLASHLGKYDGLFARLCVIFHCIERAGSTEGIGHFIQLETAERAAKFLHGYLLKHALAFYSNVLGLSDHHARITAVAGYILARKLEQITSRDVARGDRSMRGLSRRETDIIFETLEAFGWVFRKPAPRPSDPPHWIVNPQIHALFLDRAATERRQRAETRATIVALLKDGGS